MMTVPRKGGSQLKLQRILILSDSVALPRTVPEVVPLESTWPMLLKEMMPEYYEVIQNSIGGATTSDLLKQVFYYKSVNPSITILQCGIVDLSPRAFLRHEIDFSKRFRLTNSLMHRIGKNKSLIKMLRRIRRVSYVHPTEFRQNLISFRQAFPYGLYWINVPSRVEGYETFVPNIIKNIRTYNNIIADTFRDNTIDISSFSADELMSDFHHLNVLGHAKLSQMIMDKLTQVNAIK